MFHRHETTGSATDDVSNEAPAIDLIRLRAALRLIFDGETADRIAANAGSASIETTIKRVSSSARWEWRVAQIRARLRRTVYDDIEQPLGLRSGAPALGAITLALHLGLGLPVETIARATSTGAGQLGNDLYQTRLKLEPSIHPPCSQFIASIGRYRDGSLDIAARATLIQHAQHCHACRTALDRFQALDARLIAQIELERAALPPLSEQPAPAKLVRFRQPLALVTALVVVVILVGAGGYAVASRRAHIASSADEGNTLSGWLLTADVSGNVSALNLATGQLRPLNDATESRQPGFVPSSTALSPNKQLIATQAASSGQQEQQELVIARTNGSIVNRIALDASNAVFAGWLGNDTVLEITYPLPTLGESQNVYANRAQTHASLSGLDISTGKQHELFNGAVSEVYPSPDATMIVLVTGYPRNNYALKTIELRAIEGNKVGASVDSATYRVADHPVLAISDRLVSQPVWAPDSSRFFVGISDKQMASATPVDAETTPQPSSIVPLQLVSIARDGTQTSLPEPSGGVEQFPISISPDGARLIVESSKPGNAGNQSRVWELNLSSNSFRLLSDWSPYLITPSVWSPDGSTLLGSRARPFLLTPTDSNALIDVQVQNIVALSRSGPSVTVLTRMSGDLGDNLVAWLPANALSEAASSGTPIRLSQPQPAKIEQNMLRVEETAQVSDSRDFMILHDPQAQRPMIWDRGTGTGRNLPPGTHDLTWFPNTTAVLAVGTAQTGQPNAPSRITTFAATFSTSMPGYDYQTYDPAQIGSSLTANYASPLISPNETALAFFVLDSRDQSVSLWLADYDGVPKPVAHWALPNDNKLSYEPIAGWINNQTLLFAEPGDWHSGLPGEVQLNRLTVQIDGSATIDTAVTLKPHGTERGIAIDELALNQASGQIAYRLRHFTKDSTNDGIVDTISIASTAKLTDALEISRGGSSSGLSWSPDGRLLVATTSDALEFYSASGNALFGVSGLDFPNDPRWVDQSDVWFNESNDQGSKIMTVQLQ